MAPISGKKTQPLSAWFQLTPEERLILAGILLIALIGIAARYTYLKHQTLDPFTPASAVRLNDGGGP